MEGLTAADEGIANTIRHLDREVSFFVIIVVVTFAPSISILVDRLAASTQSLLFELNLNLTATYLPHPSPVRYPPPLLTVSQQ